MAIRFRTPKTMEYPGGYSVTILIVARDAIVDQEHGEFDPTNRTILVAKDLSPAERRWVLLHEKRHADADYDLWFHQTYAVKAPEGAEIDPTEVAEDDEAPQVPEELA